MVHKPAASSKDVSFAVSADSTIPDYLETAKQLGRDTPHVCPMANSDEYDGASVCEIYPSR